MLRGALESFNRLNLPARIAGALAAIAVIGASVLIFRGPALWVILAGVLVILAALLVYRLVLKAQEKRRESPMFKALMGNAAATPIGISEPARRARLDDLRKNFESGLEKFRAAGKSVYALPWYVMVGEPGSGKTEMIRHSNIGFPSGLQDQLQGSGGTLNMHWWFTNSAVILDTAGRLMFEEVGPGTTSEWEELLKQLRRNRPNCPINGMFLVIPAESLIKDSTESIERKGGRIAQQLDAIQRTLGVRFPVFVVITKCDLINGFREFFDEINEPQLQHQMLGWSNPANLDTPFDPELVEDHLRAVQKRLIRRRTGLLLDPVHSEDPKAHRIDQVDALYAFPDSLGKIGPRLRRYLEMIFVAGEWAQKPLFLRGIYFNSAMREGAALDAELAEALGVPLESLPEGRVWTRDKSYFIRDLMTSKAFREKGLVTRASNTTKLQRRRRAAVIGTAAVGLALLAGVTYLGDRSLKRNIVPAADFWHGVGAAYVGTSKDGQFQRGPGLVEPDPHLGITEPLFLPIVVRSSAGDEHWTYRGRAAEPFERLDVPSNYKTIAKFPLVLKDRAATGVPVPPQFRWLAPTEGNLLEGDRRQAARWLVEGSVLRPLVNAAEVRFDLEKDAPWSVEATGALAQLIRLEVAALPGARPGTAGIVDVEPLLLYALKGNPDDARLAQEDCKDLREALTWFYSSASGGEWPPASLTRSRAPLIDSAVKRFEAAWTGGEKATPEGAGFAGVRSLVQALRDFGEKEADLLRLRDQAGGEWAAFSAAWTMRYREVVDAAQRVEERLAVLRDPDKGTARSLSQAFESELTMFRRESRRQHERLLDELKPIAPGSDGRTPEAFSDALKSKEKSRAEALEAVRLSLEQSLADSSRDSRPISDARADAAKLDAVHLGHQEPLFRARTALYQLANARISEQPPSEPFRPGSAGRALVAVREQAIADSNAIGEKSGSGDLFSAARALCSSAIELGASRRRAEVISRFIETAPSDAGRIADIARSVTAASGAVKRPAVPLTNAPRNFDDRYSPAAGAAILGDYSTVRRALTLAEAPVGSSAGGAIADAQTLAAKFAPTRQGAVAYLREYVAYWTRNVVESEHAIGVNGGWNAWPEAIRQSGRAELVNRALSEVVAVAQQAADALDKAVDKEGLSSEERMEVERLAQMTRNAQRTLESDRFREQSERATARWEQLPASAEAARAEVLNAWLKGGINDYVVTAGVPDASADLARLHWLKMSQAIFASLAKEGGGAPVRAARQLLGFGFPLGPMDQQMAPADLEQALRAHQATRGAVAATGAGSGRISSVGDAQIDDTLKKMLAEDAVSEADEKALQRVGAILDVLRGGDLKCSLTLIRGKQGSFDQLPEVGISRNGALPDKWASLYETGRESLGSISTPSSNNELLAVDNTDKPTQRASAPIPGQWGALGLMAASRSAPLPVDGSRSEFDVEAPVSYRGQQIPLWVRLKFSKDLPEGWPYR